MLEERHGRTNARRENESLLSGLRCQASPPDYRLPNDDLEPFHFHSFRTSF